ncbi:hypothetical protein ACIVBQ_000574 [Tenacibaculum discolor]
MNKISKNNSPVQQHSNSAVALYNNVVEDFLKSNPISPIVQYAIKIFKDNAIRNKLTDNQYNKEVEQFNARYGYYITKKSVAAVATNATKYYSYINYPYLDRNAVKQTMDNYRKYVADYNAKVDKENEEISKYNSGVIKSTDKKILATINTFKKEYNKEFTRVYNAEVETFNDGFENKILPKRRIQKVRFSTELVFHVLVGFYVSQLKTRNAYLLEMNRPTSVAKNQLPKLKIDHRKLATHKISEITRLDFCKKTAQNHVKRLREAGILINYLKINQNKPVSVNFNPEILVIFEGNQPKSQLAKKQLVNYCNEKNLHYNNETTRAFLKEKEIKDCANATVGNKCGSMQEIKRVSPADSYKNTTEIIKEFSPGRAKISKRKVAANQHEALTENFLLRLSNEKQLATDLHYGVYNTYKGLRYDYLQKVAQYAAVSDQEFKEVVTQDFIKTSAKIWKNHQNPVFEGEWKKAINYLKEVLFAKITQKETIIKKLKEYRWKLNFARKWFAKNSEVSALYPSLYFDKTRIKSAEIGFFGLHSVWKSHLKYQEKKKQQLQQQQQQSNERKRRLTHNKKLTSAIQKFDNGKLNYKQLYNYVQDNLPHDYLLMLPKLIAKYSNNLA